MIKKLSVVSILIVIAVGIIFTLLSPRQAFARGADCTDPKDGWYDCWVKLSDVNRYVNTWCSQADPQVPDGGGASKRDQCKAALLNKNSGINYNPGGLRNSAECKAGGESAQRVSSTCWVLIRTGSPWYRKLQQFGRDCKFEEPDRECSDTIIAEFLEANNWNIPDGGGASLPGGNDDRKAQDTEFTQRIATYLRWIIIGIGVVATFSVVIAGIQYSAAQDNPQAVAGAKTRINNVIIGILIYLTMFAMLQWLIPGGVF